MSIETDVWLLGERQWTVQRFYASTPVLTSHSDNYWMRQRKARRQTDLRLAMSCLLWVYYFDSCRWRTINL
jgi:hypothetical protein